MVNSPECAALYAYGDGNLVILSGMLKLNTEEYRLDIDKAEIEVDILIFTGSMVDIHNRYTYTHMQMQII